VFYCIIIIQARGGGKEKKKDREGKREEEHSLLCYYLTREEKGGEWAVFFEGGTKREVEKEGNGPSISGGGREGRGSASLKGRG